MGFLETGVAPFWAVIVALFVAAFTYYFDRRKAAAERNIEDKREHYKNLILCLKSLREGDLQHVNLLWFEYSFLWLHAPDSVIRAFNSLIEKLNEGPASRDLLPPLIGELLLQIRRDMGFGKTNLQKTEFQRQPD
jgi:hypothetical protein